MLNGGIQNLEECEQHLTKVDGVMLGRAAYQTPWLLSTVDSTLFGAEDPALTRESVIVKLSAYVEDYLANGGRLNHVTRHILGLFHQQPGGRLFRRVLSEGAHLIDADGKVLLDALAEVTQRHSNESVVE